MVKLITQPPQVQTVDASSRAATQVVQDRSFSTLLRGAGQLAETLLENRKQDKLGEFANTLLSIGGINADLEQDGLPPLSEEEEENLTAAAAFSRRLKARNLIRDKSRRNTRDARKEFNEFVAENPRLALEAGQIFGVTRGRTPGAAQQFLETDPLLEGTIGVSPDQLASQSVRDGINADAVNVLGINPNEPFSRKQSAVLAYRSDRAERQIKADEFALLQTQNALTALQRTQKLYQVDLPNQIDGLLELASKSTADIGGLGPEEIASRQQGLDLAVNTWKARVLIDIGPDVDTAAFNVIANVVDDIKDLYKRKLSGEDVNDALEQGIRGLRGIATDTFLTTRIALEDGREITAADLEAMAPLISVIPDITKEALVPPVLREYISGAKQVLSALGERQDPISSMIRDGVGATAQSKAFNHVFQTVLNAAKGIPGVTPDQAFNLMNDFLADKGLETADEAVQAEALKAMATPVFKEFMEDQPDFGIIAAAPLQNYLDKTADAIAREVRTALTDIDFSQVPLEVRDGKVRFSLKHIGNFVQPRILESGRVLFEARNPKHAALAASLNKKHGERLTVLSRAQQLWRGGTLEESLDIIMDPNKSIFSLPPSEEEKKRKAAGEDVVLMVLDNG